MKSPKSLLFALLFSACSQVALAQTPAPKVDLDCAKNPNPQACEALKAADAACQAKQGADKMACIKAKLAEKPVKK